MPIRGILVNPPRLHSFIQRRNTLRSRLRRLGFIRALEGLAYALELVLHRGQSATIIKSAAGRLTSAFSSRFSIGHGLIFYKEREE